MCSFGVFKGVCVYVCVCMCVFVGAGVCVYACMHTCVHTRMREYMCTNLYFSHDTRSDVLIFDHKRVIFFCCNLFQAVAERRFSIRRNFLAFHLRNVDQMDMLVLECVAMRKTVFFLLTNFQKWPMTSTFFAVSLLVSWRSRKMVNKFKDT